MLNSSRPRLKAYRHSVPKNTSAEDLVEAILGDQGIYVQLEPRWEAYKSHEAWHAAGFRNEARGAEPTYLDENQHQRSGQQALSPSSLVDEKLSDLVELCISAYKPGTVAKFFELANANETYRKRLMEIPGLTGAAEGEMEKHYAKEALKRITEKDNGHEDGYIALSSEMVSDIKDLAEMRLEQYLQANHIQFHWEDKDDKRRIRADAEQDNAMISQARRIFRLDETIKPFPYTHNYEHIAYGEKHLLTEPHAHGNYPESLLKEQQEVLLRGRSPKEKVEQLNQHPETFGIPLLPEKYMTFVGSGALPLTGLMNHIISGCKINLVDNDPEAVEISRNLVTHLELLGVLEKGAVKVYTADGRDVHYGGPTDSLDRAEYAGEMRNSSPHIKQTDDGKTVKGEKDKLYIPTDIIYIAGLIPNDIKQEMLLNLEANERDPVRNILVRSARGLSGMLYDPVRNGEFHHNSHYHTHGTLVPERHICACPDFTKNPKQAVEEDVTTPASVSAILSDDNVNTAILLHRSDLPLIDPQVMFEKGSKFAEQVEKDLGKKPDFSHWER